MPNRLKVVLGVLGTSVVLLLAVAVFLYYLITKSYPVRSGTVEVQGIQAEVKIYRDDYGIPHIMATSEYDAYFAVGYVHAQDRLWQMELIRRAGQGRLSEVLGEPALKIDKMFRTLGIWRQVQKTSSTIDQKSHDALQAYADGVTQFIATHKGKYPIEFDLLNCEPEPWTVQHSLLVSRLMAWELNYSRWVKLILGELVERLGTAKAEEIFPTWPEGAPLIVPEELKGKKSAGMAQQILDAEGSFKKLLGNVGLESGSNAWVVAGS